MAQGKIIVSTEEIKSVAKSIETLADNYHTEFTDLYKIVDSLASTGVWNGVDNVAYVEKINGFKDDFARMESLMRQYAAFLTNAANGYKTTQTHITNQVDKKLVTSI